LEATSRFAGIANQLVLLAPTAIPLTSPNLAAARSAPLAFNPFSIVRGNSQSATTSIPRVSFPVTVVSREPGPSVLFKQGISFANALWRIFLYGVECGICFFLHNIAIL